MSKQLIDDAEEAYGAWKDAPSGSYLEKTISRSIVRDLFPSMLHTLKRKQNDVGFEKEEK